MRCMAHTSVKISANSSDYQSQMKSAASQMKVLSSEFKLAQTQAKAFGSAADQLKAKAESLPVAFDIEEVREIKTGMDKDAKTYYDDMVKKGTELLAEMKALATTVELEDDATQIKYRMGISNGTLYFEEITKEASE